MPTEGDRIERRLAAILVADVAGYSRLMGRDEAGTLAQLRAVRRELIDPKVAEHRGRVVKTTGDGILLEFQSVVDALRYATEVQQQMAVRNADIPLERRIEFRMGIHQGDIVVEDSDIFGDGVNIAARLETLAEPGGISVSRRVQETPRASWTSPSRISASRVSRTSRDRSGSSGLLRASAPARQVVPAYRCPTNRRLRPAVPEHERRSSAGIFCRRYG